MARTLTVVVFLSMVLVRASLAQQPATDPVAEAPMRVGPLGIGPTVAITNFGVDTNVFNEPTNPKRDFTFTTSPGLDVWLRARRSLLSLNTRLDFVYFNQYASERSVNGVLAAQYEHRFNRVRPFAEFRALNTRERPGFEIDARARHFEHGWGVGADVRVAGKSYLEVAARRVRVDYDGDAVFGGRPLSQALNHRRESLDLTWRQRLTALTTWTVQATDERERFEFERDRNANSARLRSGFELSRFALIRGAAFVGYRRLVPADGGTIPDFSGATADVDVSYSSPTQTRLGLKVHRDIEYSYEIERPYYVQTGWSATLTQRVIGRWDVQLLGGRDWLAYNRRDRGLGAHTDIVNHVGGGIGYQLGEDTRLGVDVTSVQRESPIAGRSYKAIRAGGTVSYAF